MIGHWRIKHIWISGRRLKRWTGHLNISLVCVSQCSCSWRRGCSDIMSLLILAVHSFTPYILQILYHSIHPPDSPPFHTSQTFWYSIHPRLSIIPYIPNSPSFYTSQILHNSKQPPGSPDPACLAIKQSILPLFTVLDFCFPNYKVCKDIFNQRKKMVLTNNSKDKSHICIE